jgi:hypothetical protein
MPCTAVANNVERLASPCPHSTLAHPRHECGPWCHAKTFPKTFVAPAPNWVIVMFVLEYVPKEIIAPAEFDSGVAVLALRGKNDD